MAGSLLLVQLSLSIGSKFVVNENQQRWDEKYRRGEHLTEQPDSAFLSVANLLPRSGRALDLAGGAGRHAIWLAQRGLHVTLVDISEVALELARQRATLLGVQLETVRRDVEKDSLIHGEWNLIVVVHFLWMPLLREVTRFLAPDGLFVFVQPTRKNLERHDKPSARFLLEDGALPSLVPGINVQHYEERWFEDGRHQAVLVGKHLAHASG